MKISKEPFYLLLSAFLAIGVANAQTTIKKVPAKPTVAVDGKTLFGEYCAVCHGKDGKGAGPASAALKPSPSDLTQIARRNNGKFSDDRMMNILIGEVSVAAHGDKDMPIWGNVFHNMNSSPSMAQMRLHALVQYLGEIQAK